MSYFERLVAFCEKNNVEDNPHATKAISMMGPSKEPTQGSVRFLCVCECCSAKVTRLGACVEAFCLRLLAVVEPSAFDDSFSPV